MDIGTESRIISKNPFKRIPSAIEMLVVALMVLVLSFAGFPNPTSLDLPEQRPNWKTVSGTTPGICIGYDLEENSWGYGTSCPQNYAFFSVQDPSGKKLPGEKISIAGKCCPLPSDDVLLKEQVFSDMSCPEAFIATGTKIEEENVFLRCTRINSFRYQLGAPTPALYWGNGYAGWKFSERIDRSKIPAGIRYSVGRRDKDIWDVDGCVGHPWGSVLTRKTSKYCGGMYFRQLQFSGSLGDPERGTPVQMFASCKTVENVKDPKRALCIK